MDQKDARKSQSSIENLDFRFGSGSSQTSQTSGDFCRICHESDFNNPLLTPCLCSGSLRYVHQQCLQTWIYTSETSSCELCKFPFIMQSKIKPFNQWRSLDMSGVERRRLFCAVLFHLAAALCVIWSLCVLIERAADEMRSQRIFWPFWTKLIVVTVGLTGGIVFMYIQCKQYLNLCSRWRARNRILLIQNAPEKIVVTSQVTHSPVIHYQPSNADQNSTLNRINSSILVNVPLNNTIEQNQQQYELHHNLQHENQNQQSQIIANIENNSLNYEIEDDISYSQISFKQNMRNEGGSSSRGSLHNVYDNTSTSNTSATTRNFATSGDNDSNLFKTVPCGLHEVKENEDDQLRRSDKMTSIFIENSDILNDQHYPKVNYRHSTFFLPTTSTAQEELEKRRYSDTKLVDNIYFDHLLNNSETGSSEKLFLEKRDPLKCDEHNIPPNHEQDNIDNFLDKNFGPKEENSTFVDSTQNNFQSLPNLEIP